MIERAHYLAQLLWVSGNMVWALGEFYFASYDEAFSMGERNYEARRTPRWWASWVLCCAYVPIFLLYVLWIPLTMTGRISQDNGEGESVGDTGMDLGMGINMNVLVTNPIVAITGCVIGDDVNDVNDKHTFAAVHTDNIIHEDTDGEGTGSHPFEIREKDNNQKDNTTDGLGSYHIVIGDEKPALQNPEIENKKSHGLPVSPNYKNVKFNFDILSPKKNENGKNEIT